MTSSYCQCSINLPSHNVNSEHPLVGKVSNHFIALLRRIINKDDDIRFEVASNLISLTRSTGVVDWPEFTGS